MSVIILPILGGLATASPPKVGYSTALRPYLKFDGTTDQYVQHSFKLPGDYVSGMAWNLMFSMASATVNNIAFRSQVMAVSDGENVSTDSFDTLQVSSDVIVPGTAGLIDMVTFSLTNIDLAAAGDYLCLQIGRENGTSGTNATGELYLWGLSLTYATS